VPDAVEIVTLEERDRWEAEHAVSGLPSQSWGHAWALSASGIEPQLAVVHGGGARMLLPFFERSWGGSTDVATIWALSGASIEPTSAAPLAVWRDYGASRGWVAGYVQLAPASDFRAELSAQDELVTVNTVFLLDISSPDVLASADPDVRRKVRKADDLGLAIVTDRARLSEAMKELYPSTMERTGARPRHRVAPETLARWAQDPTSLLLGAGAGGSIEAVSLFCAARTHAEYQLSASTADGRWLAAWLISNAIERLRRQGVDQLNLGGGVRPGDGVYAFKEQFGARPRPLLAVRQVYDVDAYEELCRLAGVQPGGGWFPPYRAAEADASG
jgi:hypothetical protein